MMKLPAFQFYPGDWQKDPSLRVCSHAAKGVLMDTTCIMFECDPRGVLITGGRVWSDKDWAAAVGGNADVTLGCIRELVETGAVKQRGRESQGFVFEHADILEGIPTGAYYSFRLIRDEYHRVLGRERQAEHRSRKRNAESNGVVTGVSPPSSSSTSSSPSGTDATNKPERGKSMLWPTESDAVAYGDRIGVPADDAKRFWHHYESMGWIDKNGHPIRNWQSKLTVWKTEGQQQKHVTRTSSNGDSFWKDSKRLDMVEADIKAIEGRASHTAMDVIIQPEDKDRYAELRKERKALKAKIGGAK